MVRSCAFGAKRRPANWRASLRLTSPNSASQRPTSGYESFPSRNRGLRATAGASFFFRPTWARRRGRWPGSPRPPASEMELRSLTALFTLVPGKSIFKNEAASARNLKALDNDGTLIQARYLVFSAHAFADLTDPEVSSVVLSVPKGGAPRDAYFTATEMAALKLNSELVYFSACETGYGQVVSGEGVISLSSAALVAGARSTIHTLWSVVDSATAEFTKRFFTAVRRGVPPEEALTRTKREFSMEPRHSSPAYWASYVLVQARW